MARRRWTDWSRVFAVAAVAFMCQHIVTFVFVPSWGEAFWVVSYFILGVWNAYFIGAPFGSQKEES